VIALALAQEHRGGPALQLLGCAREALELARAGIGTVPAGPSLKIVNRLADRRSHLAPAQVLDCLQRFGRRVGRDGEERGQRHRDEGIGEAANGLSCCLLGMMAKQPVPSPASDLLAGIAGEANDLFSGPDEPLVHDEITTQAGAFAKRTSDSRDAMPRIGDDP
jgi:hypothetical protein